MKTTNNVQKAITKSLAVIISLVLLSITVNAQNFWKTVFENNSFSQIAMAMVDVSETSTAPASANTTSDTYAEYYVVESEEALNMENWMENENNFFTILNIETEVENTLEIENWMCNENLFDGTAAYFVEETEEALELEEWMQDMDSFGVQTLEIEEETEQSLELEAWMTDNTIWVN